MQGADIDWLNLSPSSPLRTEEVHLWRAFLDVPLATLQALQSCLNVEERRRAERFHQSRDRHRFIVARGLLRHILGRYTQQPPEQIVLTANAFGKPALVETAGSLPLHFNLSHSEGWSLVALTSEHEVGVDLERIRPDFDGEEIARSFFSQTEVAALHAAPDCEKTALFFHLWTQKEAYLKGRGMGLTAGLNHFCGLPDPAGSSFWTIQTEDGNACGWTGRTVFPVEGFVGAVAVGANQWCLRCGEWSLIESTIQTTP